MEHGSFPGTVQGAGNPEMKSQGPALVMVKVGWDSVVREVHGRDCFTRLDVGGCVQQTLPGDADSRDQPSYGLSCVPHPKFKSPGPWNVPVCGDRVFKEVVKVK